jgi:spore coat protein CotH
MARLCAVALVLAVSTLPAGAQTQEDFFTDSLVHDIRLTLSSRDWQTLKARANEDTYYPADLAWRGVTVRNIGIRSRGAGTRSGTKPGLRVDINRYLHDQEFLGLKAFVLDNALLDPSLIHESVAMKLYARMGLIVPRESPARLFVNDEYVGAYVIVEAIDRTFVSRVFGLDEGDVEDGGYLFEYRWAGIYGFEYLGPGLEPYASLFEPHTRETDSMFNLYRPFEQLARSIAESPPERILPDVGRFIDLPGFITLLAVQNFLAELDGLVGKWGMANFFVYRFRDGGAAKLIPWDADHAFSLPTDLSIDYRLNTNVLVRGIMAEPELRRFYLDALRRTAELSAHVDAGDSRGWLEREIDRQASLIAPSVAADPVTPFTSEQFEAAVAALRNFSRVRTLYVRCAVDLALNPDQDGPLCLFP